MQLNNQISQGFTGKTSFEETSVSDWKNIADNYPAFGLAQLFLAKRLKENNEAYLQQLPKTALRFSDALWLNVFLADEPEIVSNEKIGSVKEAPIISEKTDDDAVAESRLSSMLQAQAAAFVKPVSDDEQLPSEKEPLYKTDYFASQGILSAKPNDALGNKVKKFTDWLKDIKKTSAGVPQLNTTEEEEKQAEAQAMASLKVEEVVTEPMAEVLVRQNKKIQAIEIYKKLSLLYPEKSAYFAAKINSLQ